MKQFIIVFLLVSSAILNARTASQGPEDTLRTEIPEEPGSGSYQPGDHELIFMPTAYTMPSGEGYFSDYELIFLNFTFAPTGSTHIGFFTGFPISGTFVEETFTLGFKQNYLRLKKLSAALWGSYTVKPGLYSVGNVFSYGEKGTSIHAGISYAASKETEGHQWLILLGFRKDLSAKVSGIIEYTNAASLINDADFNGLISFGLRFRTNSVSWELAGIRPLEETGDLLFFPMLKATVLF